MRATCKWIAILYGLILGGVCNAQDVVIGQSLPITGPQGLVAESARDGAEALFQAVNKQGGVGSRQLKLLTFDDEFKPEKTAANVRDLATQKNAVALISVIGAPGIQAAVPVATESGMPIVGVMNGNAAFRNDKSAIITHVRATFARELEVIVQQYTSLGITRFAVFHPDDAPGTAAGVSTIATLAAKNLKPLANVGFDRATKDFGPYAQQLVQANPEVIIVFSPTRPATELITAVRARGFNTQFVCLSVVDDRNVFATLKENARGIAFSSVVPNPFDISIPLVREYQKNMRDAGKTTFSIAGLEGYINAKVVVEALKRVKGMPTRVTLKAALDALPDLDLGGVQLKGGMTPDKAGLDSVDVIMLSRDGKLIR